MNLTSKN